MQEEGVIQYNNNLVLSEDRIEQDEDYGICESRKQTLTVDWTNKHAKYFQDYYYSVQQSYQEVTNVLKKTALQGKFDIEGDIAIVNVQGSYVDYSRRQSVEEHDIKKDKVTGTLKFMKTQNGVKVTEVKLLEDGQQFETYFKDEIHFQKS